MGNAQSAEEELFFREAFMASIFNVPTTVVAIAINGLR
jgi:hypothetical protein